LRAEKQTVPITLGETNQRATSGGPAGGGLDDLKLYGGGGSGEQSEGERLPPPEGYRIALWLTLVGVTSLFTTLVVVYVWLAAQQAHLPTPRLFWLSTSVVLACSATLEAARRALRKRREVVFNRWLGLTMTLGLVFLGAQYLGLRQLTAAGFFATANKRAWLAFLITGSHAAHLAGGLFALVYLLLKSRYGDWTALRRRITMEVVTLYWHFIGGIWLLLFALLFLWN
jgi:cytochrome c oxidase subunit III